MLVQRVIEGNFLSGSRVAIKGGEGGEGEVISHLFYAVDTLLFCEPKKYQIKFMSWTLIWFEAMSGLRINLSKSEIIPIGPVGNVDKLALELLCGVGSLPTLYLGLPLGAPHKASRVWDSIEEWFRKRLASWKTQYISKGGRITLIRSTLSSLSIYYSSLFRMSQKVCNRLERIQRQFLWGGGSLEKKLHLVKWATVCTEKIKGGLGMRNFSRLNKALLCKWSWRFANERNVLWRKVVSSKFGETVGGWHSCDIRGGTHVTSKVAASCLLVCLILFPSVGITVVQHCNTVRIHRSFPQGVV